MNKEFKYKKEDRPGQKTSLTKKDMHIHSSPDLNARKEIRRICSHDIKSPLTAILDSCSMLFECQADNAFGDEIMDNIRDATTRVFEMIDRIQILIAIQDQIDDFHEKPINLVSSIQAVEKNLHSTLKEKDIQLIIKSASNQIFVDSMAFRMRGDRFTFYSIFNYFIKAIAAVSSQASNVLVEIVHEDNIGVKISSEGKLPNEIETMANYLSGKTTDLLISKIEWMITCKLLRMTGASISTITNYDNNYHLLIRFPIIKQLMKDCENV